MVVVAHQELTDLSSSQSFPRIIVLATTSDPLSLVVDTKLSHQLRFHFIEAIKTFMVVVQRVLRAVRSMWGVPFKSMTSERLVTLRRDHPFLF